MPASDSMRSFHRDLRCFMQEQSLAIGPPSRAAESQFNELALRLFHLQFLRCRPYRNLCRKRGLIPERLRDWRQIPPVSTTAFREWDLTCLRPSQCQYFFVSSGTTGPKASRHFHSPASLGLYETSVLLNFEHHFSLSVPWNDQEPHRRKSPSAPRPCILSLTPPREQAPHSSLVHMFDTISRVHGGGQSRFVGMTDASGGWILNLDSALAFLRQAAVRKQPVVMMGTAFSYVHLIDGLVERRIEAHLPPGSCALETGGYKGRSRSLPKTELHDLMQRHLGLEADRIVCEYGMCELSSQAYDQIVTVGQTASPPPTSGLRRLRFPAWARGRVISPETQAELTNGELGLIQVFDLANTYSIQAIQTEDLGRSFGGELELIGRAVQAENRGCSLLPIELG